jgi:hypothetical protein
MSAIPLHIQRRFAEMGFSFTPRRLRQTRRRMGLERKPHHQPQRVAAPCGKGQGKTRRREPAGCFDDQSVAPNHQRSIVLNTWSQSVVLTP